MAFSLPLLWSNSISRRFPPLCSLFLRLRNTKVPVWTHETIGYPKMDITYWDATIHYGIQLAQYCHQTRSCNALFTEIANCVLPCPKTQEHQITCVDSWVHRVPENGQQPLGRGNSLWRSAYPILWSNPILLCYFTDIALLCIGYPKMDIRYWGATTHYGIQLAQYCHQTRSCNALFTEIANCLLPCPKTEEHQSTCVNSWVHKVPKNGHPPLGRGNSLWHSASPILWSNPIV